MKTIRCSFPFIIFSLLIFVTSSSAIHAQEVERRPLDHSVYDHWNRIAGQMLSADGRWAAYTLAPQDGGDVTLMVKSLRTDAEFQIVQGTAARFTADSRYLICLIRPTEDDIEQAEEEEEEEPDERPKNQLGILDLREGRIERIEQVKSFKIPEDEGRWIAYLKEKPIESDESEEGGAERLLGLEGECECSRVREILLSGKIGASSQGFGPNLQRNCIGREEGWDFVSGLF